MRFFRRGEDASTLDLLVAGLGNPGREYEHTRHNLGWLVLDELARRHGGSWRSQEFERLRIGVGRPGRGDPRSVSDWVLSGFAPDDDLETLVSRASDAVETIAAEGLPAAQARFN